MKPIYSVRMMACLLALPIFAQTAYQAASGQAGTNRVSVEQLVSEVLSNSPALAAARLKWHAMEERPEIARALPDPMLTYGYWFQSVETRVGPMNQRVAASQKIPFWGKRSLAADKARQEALLTMWNYQALRRDLIRRAKMAYYDLYLVDRSREILEAQLQLLNPIVQTAQSRYAAGQADQQDVLKAQVATSEIQNRILGLTQRREGALARINALRNAAPGAELTVSSSLKLPALPAREQTLEVATDYRQELQAAGVAIQRDEIALNLAKKDRWPDFTFGVDYTQIDPSTMSSPPPDSGKDAVQGFVSVNVPLWFGKLRAERREAEEQLEASRAAETNVRNSVTSEVQDAWFRAQVNGDQLSLYETSLLPRAQQTFEASRAGYEAARVSFIDLLDSERVLLNFRLGRVMTETDLAKALADLERAVGVDLNDVSKWNPARASDVQSNKP